MPYIPFKTNRAITALIASVVFFLLLVWMAWSFTSAYLLKPGMRKIDFNYWILLFPVIGIAEALVYHWLKNKYIIRSYANLHIVSFILRMTVMPLLSLLLAVVLPNYMTMEEFAIEGRLYKKILGWAGDIVLVTGHVFFILVIIKRNSRPTQEPASENDHLQQFEHP